MSDRLLYHTAAWQLKCMH